jgi:hypothetical protein
MTGTNGNGNGNGSARVGTSTVKQGLAQMLKGGVIVSFPNEAWRSKMELPVKLDRTTSWMKRASSGSFGLSIGLGVAAARGSKLFADDDDLFRFGENFFCSQPLL